MKVRSKSKTQGVSLPVKMAEDVDNRIRDLRPWVNGFSSYIQRLIDLDQKLGLIRDDGSINTDALTKLKSSDMNPTLTKPSQRKPT